MVCLKSCHVKKKKNVTVHYLSINITPIICLSSCFAQVNVEARMFEMRDSPQKSSFSFPSLLFDISH